METRGVGSLGRAEKCLAAFPCVFQELIPLPLGLFGAFGCNGTRMLGEIGKLPHQAGIEELTKRIVDGLKFQIDELIVEVRERRAR